MKELGVCTFMPYTRDYAAYTSCVFAPPYEPPLRHLCTVGDGILHGIAWECGVIHLSQLGPILHRAVEDVARLYCKGASDAAFVKSLLEDETCEVRDLDRLFMPSFSRLPTNSHAPVTCSVSHPPGGECAVRKSSSYAAWLCDHHRSS